MISRSEYLDSRCDAVANRQVQSNVTPMNFGEHPEDFKLERQTKLWKNPQNKYKVETSLTNCVEHVAHGHSLREPDEINVAQGKSLAGRKCPLSARPGFGDIPSLCRRSEFGWASKLVRQQATTSLCNTIKRSNKHPSSATCNCQTG